MQRIRQLLAAVAERLRDDNRLLAKAQRRYKANHKRAFRAYAQQIRVQKRADVLRAEGNISGAALQDKFALRFGHIVSKNRAKAAYWVGQIKTQTQRIHNLEHRQAELEAEAAAWRKKHHVVIDGNKATGGSKSQRLVAVARASAAACAAGRRANFYSQPGAFDVDHCITGESYGERSDCSSWFTSAYRSCNLADPNGERYTAGYTGTLGEHGHIVSRGELKGGEAVLYGDYPHHHVEMVVDPERGITIGHGSAPVDQGVFDLFGDGNYIFRSYV